MVVNLGLDVLNDVRRFNIECDGPASKSIHKDLNTSRGPDKQPLSSSSDMGSCLTDHPNFSCSGGDKTISLSS